MVTCLWQILVGCRQKKNEEEYLVNRLAILQELRKEKWDDGVQYVQFSNFVIDLPEKKNFHAPILRSHREMTLLFGLLPHILFYFFPNNLILYVILLILFLFVGCFHQLKKMFYILHKLV